MTDPTPKHANATSEGVAAQVSPQGDAITPRNFLPCIWMAAWVLGVAPILLGYGYWKHQETGMMAAALAGLVCLFAAEASLLSVIMTRNPQHKIHAVLVGIFFRTGIPLVFGMFMHFAGGPLVDAGLFGMILIYYLLTLALETIFAVQVVAQSSSYKKAV